MINYLFDDDFIDEIKPSRLGKRKGRKVVEFPHESHGQARKYIRRKLVEKETLKQMKEYLR